MTVGVDTWVTLAEANAYLTYRMGAGAWFALSDDSTPGATSKTLLLVNAFNGIRSALGFNVPQVTDDPNVKTAQIECAYYLLNYFGEVEARDVAQAAGLASFEFSKRKETFTGESPRLPYFVTAYLADYSNIGGSFVDLAPRTLK